MPLVISHPCRHAPWWQYHSWGSSAAGVAASAGAGGTGADTVTAGAAFGVVAQPALLTATIVSRTTPMATATCGQ
ncbi:MAG: hypothetical protein HYV42_03475 [Candidatus Magasanikbacteria bacterium]|nr:hypothetical protein [Candidatus Magasanikbacteria bacterium]